MSHRATVRGGILGLVTAMAFSPSVTTGQLGPPMTPSAYNNNMQQFQTEEHVVILNEMVHNARIVPLDGRPHLPSDLRQWVGDSRASWDGDTLVIRSGRLREYVIGAGGADKILHFGSRMTPELLMHISFGGEINQYEITLATAGGDGLAPLGESVYVRATTPRQLAPLPLSRHQCHVPDQEDGRRQRQSVPASRRSQRSGVPVLSPPEAQGLVRPDPPHRAARRAVFRRFSPPPSSSRCHAAFRHGLPGQLREEEPLRRSARW